MLKDMFKKTYTRIDAKYKSFKSEEEPNIPEGLWRKCNKCRQPIYIEDVKNNYYVCPKCGGYFRVHARRRIEMIVDEGKFEEWNKEMEFSNPLDFPGYEKKVLAARQKTGLNEAIVTGKGVVDGHPAVIGVCDARFLMSSMGYIVGEKITCAVERATKEKLPVIFFVCSGGARMQEGMVSLMQMAKTSAALKRHQEAGQLYITILTDPTTGGVTASFAMLGDIILAEPKALIGFAGPRVIEQTIGQKLPEGFQRSEFLLEHGFVDKIVERRELKNTLARILEIHENRYYTGINSVSSNKNSKALKEFSSNLSIASEKKDYSGKTPWDTVILSRKSNRPTALDYIEKIFDDFMELHGDRYFRDDGAIVGGIAMFHGIPVTVIGQQKGRNTKDNIKRNFGMPSPEGYRKALRLMKEAEQFQRPIICFVDTPGAFCGLEAEERGQSEAIARNLFEMSAIKAPILSIVIGEGGSGGALAMAVANQVWMLENSIYSVLSPEGFASILWKDSKKAPEAARSMKMTARDLKELNLIEYIVPERNPASLENLSEIAEKIDTAMRVFFDEYQGISGDQAAALRYERFRRM